MVRVWATDVPVGPQEFALVASASSVSIVATSACPAVSCPKDCSGAVTSCALSSAQVFSRADLDNLTRVVYMHVAESALQLEDADASRLTAA